MSPALPFVMKPSRHAATAVPTVGRGIDFTCLHCSASFVVSATAAGGPLACRKCGKVSNVPLPGGSAAAEAPPTTFRAEPPKVSRAPTPDNPQLQNQLKENESQRTEITSYINQLSIQLHRWQLRLQTLNERQKKLEAALNETRDPS